MKILTIAVPAYNMAHYLGRCLDSMIDVRFGDMLEVVVVDDGSSDGTLALARQYEKKHPEVFRAATQPNGGHGAAVNTGLRLATGKYFRIVDADDWVNTDALHHLLKKMSDTDCDLFVDEKTEVNITTKAVRRYPMPEDARFGEKQSFRALTDAAYDMSLSMHTMSVRTRLLREWQLQLLEHTFYVDMQFVIGVSAMAQTCCLLRERVYNYQVGDVNQSVFYLNYVKRYDQHDHVLSACIDFCDRNEDRLPEGRSAYLAHALALLARSQLKIALIYDPDKAQGRRRAREMKRRLMKAHPDIWREAHSRYCSAMMLNLAGVGQRQLEWLMALRNRRR